MKKGQPGDFYWVFMGDAPPVVVESGVIGPDGERIRDPEPYWRPPKRTRQQQAVIDTFDRLFWVLGVATVIGLLLWGLNLLMNWAL